MFIKSKGRSVLIITFLCLDESLIDGFKNQISSLVIAAIAKECPSSKLNTRLFECILNMFTNLKYLNYSNFNRAAYHQQLSFEVSPPTIFSSTLLELKVKVRSIDDCLYLLDGRFSQLQVFDVDIDLTRCRSFLSKINKVYFD